MNKNRRFIKSAACLLLVCVLSLLGGCQLAREDEPAASADRFVGISVLLETEIQFNAPLSGEYVDRSIPHDVDGEPLYLEITRTEDGAPIMGINAGKWFVDLHTHFNTVDTEQEQSESVSFEGIMYVCREELSSTPYLQLEQVYQREDGTLYAIDCGNNYAGSLDGLTITLNESRTVSDSEGNSSLEATEIKLHVKERPKVSQVCILAMSSMEILESFTAQEASELWLPADTEWVLVEEVLSDGSVQRTAYNQPLNNTHITLYTVCENGVFLPQILTLRTAQEGTASHSR